MRYLKFTFIIFIIALVSSCTMDVHDSKLDKTKQQIPTFHCSTGIYVMDIWSKDIKSYNPLPYWHEIILKKGNKIIVPVDKCFLEYSNNY